MQNSKKMAFIFAMAVAMCAANPVVKAAGDDNSEVKECGWSKKTKALFLATVLLGAYGVDHFMFDGVGFGKLSDVTKAGLVKLEGTKVHRFVKDTSSSVSKQAGNFYNAVGTKAKKFKEKLYSLFY